MEKCRFLSEKGICQIGQLALHNAEQPNDLTALTTGNIEIPNKAIANPTQIQIGFSERLVTVFVVDCSAANDSSSQSLCDTYVPKMGWVKFKKIEDERKKEEEIRLAHCDWKSF